jgi:hypothetical protein
VTCPGSLCPQHIGQGCRCPALHAAADAADVRTPDVIDMRPPDRSLYPDVYVEPDWQP